MTREKILERQKELEDERTKTQYLLLALDGAIQDCKFWLEQIDKPTESTESTINDKNSTE